MLQLAKCNPQVKPYFTGTGQRLNIVIAQKGGSLWALRNKLWNRQEPVNSSYRYDIPSKSVI